MAVCAACGQDNPEGFKFCGECAAPLAAALAPREERKVVTVLFCDLVGFTSKAEKTIRKTCARSSRRTTHLRSELERFGGRVEKFIGDAVVAVFGAPIAHEDDPERAVRAALAIRDWAAEQEGLELRVAVNTGEALVTLDSRPEQGEGMVAGDVVNTAARLQSAAPTNGILVGETTYRATRERIDYGEHEPVAAKGVAARRPDSPRTPHRGRRRLRRACGDRAGQKSRMPRDSVCRRSGILGACSGAGDSFSTIVRAVAFSCRPLLR